MAAQAQKLLSKLGQLGVGLAVAGGVAQTALYNGKINFILLVFKLIRKLITKLFIFFF